MEDYACSLLYVCSDMVSQTVVRNGFVARGPLTRNRATSRDVVSGLEVPENLVGCITHCLAAAIPATDGFCHD